MDVLALRGGVVHILGDTRDGAQLCARCGQPMLRDLPPAAVEHIRVRGLGTRVVEWPNGSWAIAAGWTLGAEAEECRS